MTGRLAAVFLALAVYFVGGASVASADGKPLTSIPEGLGFPVIVRTGVNFLELNEVNQNDGTFTAMVDIRLRWTDRRLAFPANMNAAGYLDYVGPAAKAKLEEIWSPQAELRNLVGTATYEKLGLRIYPSGATELMQRTSGTFLTGFDLSRFPFDRQRLRIELITRAESDRRVKFDFRQDELEFSNTANRVESDGWSIGQLELSQTSYPAWRGELNTGVFAELLVQRNQPSLLATVFVPLVASLLIPLLVFWLNRKEEGVFMIEAFELTNIVCGGLFAVVALNFTINSSFPGLAVGDNPVMRLFALNYITLFIALGASLLLYRFNVIRAWFGQYVQEEFFLFVNWGIPALVMATAVAIIALAAV